ncbi:cell division protein FtsA [Tumebacillus permanentifrigoris]|uniref:Cell division protein FtsA n=1 Tax=Tumebacillus permanentifrigoris TaxID=378543 RepID=A0A316DE37_9BACL|nr:cell division protein FtsA [Tumebacillus permanentifrigoris]PWK15898.1 cell division protein FtsA [Tumebacillus permanentifrigoris]
MSQPQDLIFALDIGTRSVVGLVAEHHTDGKLQVIATEVQEHTTRAMLDGQIHDVVEVAQIIRRVKEQLEIQVGPLKKVAVAAAGRALKTVRTRVDRELLNNQRLTREDVMALELTAVQQAEKQLQEITPDAARYHCVGYTVIHYLLDDSQMGSLIDQWGLQASVEIIATFLPRVVIDSLQIALERAGLEMAALTLEPIAAINALIPPTMRKLNLALVDIGAGTSDIALTAEGTVTAYGMVPVAGDEVTEALSQKYLLDFPVAEEVKRKLLTDETVAFSDVLGIPYELPAREITESLFEEVSKLSQMIAHEIKNLNQRGPQAVMLIGGGSQTPMLPALLAAELGLPKERVVIRGTEAIQQLATQHSTLQGPQAVTPVGIALAAIQTPVSSVAVRINGQQHRLFEFRQITVGDCLLAADVDIRKLHGRPGLALTLEVNGRMKVLRGTHGTPAQLLLNGQPTQLDTIVQHGDELEVIGGSSGLDASGTIVDVIDPLPPLVLYFGERRYSLPPLITMNGQGVALETPLLDRAQIVTTLPQTMRDVLPLLGLPPEIGEQVAKPPVFTVTVDGHTVQMPYEKYVLFHNGEPATLDTPIADGDTVEYDELPPPVYQVRYFYDESLLPAQAIGVSCNNQPIRLEGPRPPVYRNGERAELDDLVLHGDHLHFTSSPDLRHKSENWQPVLSDLFRYIAIEKERPAHATDLVLTVNAQPATFMTPLHHGAVVTMEWV